MMWRRWIGRRRRLRLPCLFHLPYQLIYPVACNDVHNEDEKDIIRATKFPN